MHAINFLLSLISVSLTALYIKITWGWFATPVFGVDAPPWAYVFGLLIMVGFFRYLGTADIYLMQNKKVSDSDALVHTVVRMMLHLIAFIIASLFYLFAI